MLCKVWSREATSSASNTGESSITRIKVLARATMSGQSESPMARSELTALLTLRLSAAWSAACCVRSAPRSGNPACTQSRYSGE